MFKERLHPRVSKAEIEVFAELSFRNMTRGMTTQQTIVLKKTTPDFMWSEKRKAVYLDGDVVHRESEEWDTEVVQLLEKRGWQVLRISYHPPLTKEELEKIADQIQEFVGEV